MAMPTCYSTFFNNNIQEQQKFLPRCRSLKAKDVIGAVLAAIFFVGWYRHNFGGYRLNSLSSCCLAIWGFPYEVLGIYPIRKKYTFFLPTLDGSTSLLRPR